MTTASVISFLRLALVSTSIAAAHAAGAAADAPLQALATCGESWLDWKGDAARMTRFGEYVQAGFTPGDGGAAFTPKARTTVLGHPVIQLFPQSVGMGVGFSVEVQADLAHARQSMERQIGRAMTCTTSEGVTACEVELGKKRTAVLMTGDNGKAATSLLGCYYFYQQ